MSQIPKPKSTPKPNSVQKNDDLDTMQHQNLLDWLWTNLEDIVPLWIGKGDEWVEENCKKAVQSYQDKVNILRRAMTEAMEDTKNVEQAPAINTALKRIEKACSNLVLPKLPTDADIPTIARMHYQKEITVKKCNRSGDWRDEVAGYIDVELDLMMPASIAITGCPYYSEFSPQHVEKLARLTLEQAAWAVQRTERSRVWFDVRGTLPLTAVLVRELRVLQELAGPSVIIALVTEKTLPGNLEEILDHEGFWTLDRLWMEAELMAHHG